MAGIVNYRVGAVVVKRVIKIHTQQINLIESHEVGELQTDVRNHVTAEDVAAGVARELRESVQVKQCSRIRDDFIFAAKERAPIIADEFYKPIQVPNSFVMLSNHVVVFDNIVRRPPISLVKGEINFIRGKSGFRFELVEILDGQAGPIADYETALARMPVLKLLELPVSNKVRAAFPEKGQHALAVAINVKRIEALIQRHDDLRAAAVGSAGDKPDL